MAYIYEYIRTEGFEPMHFEEHYARLDALARKHLFMPFSVERENSTGNFSQSYHPSGERPCQLIIKKSS